MSTIYFAENSSGIRCRVEYSVVGDADTNTSRVQLLGVEVSASDALGPHWVTGYLYIGGSRVWGYDEWYSQIWLGQGWNAAGHCPEGAVPVTVSHAPDGTASVSFRLDLSFEREHGGYSYSGTVSEVLPTIPRVSGLTAEPVVLGAVMTLRLTRAAQDYRDTVTWRCGEASGLLAEKTAETVLHLQTHRDLAIQAPNDTAAPVTLTVQTWHGEVCLGSTELTVLCPIPGDIVPSVDFSVSDDRQLGDFFLREQSRLRVQTRAQGNYGASIAEIRVTCGSLTGTGESVVFALPDSGTVPIRVTVTDSRGRSASHEGTVEVLDWQSPAVQIGTAYRCSRDGTPDPDGAFAMVTFTARLTQLAGAQARYTLLHRLRGQQSWTEVPIPDYDDCFRLENAPCMAQVGVDQSYEFRVAARDAFARTESGTVTLAVAYALLDLYRPGNSVGIGQRAAVANTLCVGLDMKLYGHRITDLAAPAQDSDAATKAYVDECFRRLAGAQEENT